MLISKNATIKWNSKIKKHYVDLGYTFTKMKDEFVVDIKDLTDGSSASVTVKCDYCGKVFNLRWSRYLHNHSEGIISKDCCGDPSCTGKKAQEALKKKYNVEKSIWEIEEIKTKRDNTNIERYGCVNPFGNNDVKEKIRQYNLDMYNVEYSMQRPEVVEKSQKTCLEKYGVTNYGKIYSESHSRDLSPTWKGGSSYHRVERSTLEYRTWRKNVFSRDCYTCQCCGARNSKGNGKTVKLIGHHIKDWKNNVDARYETDNGITLCEECHIKFHSVYGKHGNDESQLSDFLIKYKTLDEKIC